MTDTQKVEQEKVLKIIAHPILKHAAFASGTNFQGKLNEMLSLRRGQEIGRQRLGRPSLPALNFSKDELLAVTNQLIKLAVAIDESLSRMDNQPYERMQIELKELIRGRSELTVRQLISDWPDKTATNRWKNFVAGARNSPLSEMDRSMISNFQVKLTDLLTLIVDSALGVYDSIS